MPFGDRAFLKLKNIMPSPHFAGHREYAQGHEPRLSSHNIRNRVDITLFVGDEEI